VAAQPTGTVTLLFSDIEGSTRLLERIGAERYRETLELHREVLRASFERHAGYEVDTEGDSFFVTFSSAGDAVAAALAAQRGLSATDWPGGHAVSVRIGIHTGHPLAVPSNYVGMDVHRAARIMAAAHGGQVLVSKTTRELLDEPFPVRDLGEHRLKDLSLPQRLFQIDVGIGADDFPPIRTLENRPTNLPAQRTSLVGRRQELAQLHALLVRADAPVVTVTGPGGTGKTRLALQAAAEAVDEFPNGVFFVSLAPLRSAELVVPTVAQTLGLREDPGGSIAETLRAFLTDKRILLLVDNFEHVTGAAEALAAACAPASEVKLLVTSRTPLHLSGEHTFPLAPLALPESPALADLARAEAVTLFVERALAARPDFELTETNAAAVADLCSRLDGLPLAIELAAARVRVLPPKAILNRLNQRFRLLTGGARDADARQQTLQATLDWSYDLLDEAEKTLFARLSVFKGGFRIEAAEEITDPDPDRDLGLGVLDGILALAEKSLLREREDFDGNPRFWMLESIRSYAAERLATSPERGRVADAHLRYYVRFAQDAEPHWRDPDAGPWLPLFKVEVDNLRAAIAHARATGQVALAVELLSTGAWLWDLEHVSEARVVLGEILPQARDRTSEEILASAEFALMIWGRHDAARDEEEIRRAIATCDAVGRRDLAALARITLAGFLWYRGERDQASELLAAAERTAGELADGGVQSWAVGLRVAMLAETGEIEAARALLNTERGSPYYATNTNHLIGTLLNASDIELGLEDGAAAMVFAEQALARAMETNDTFQLPDAHMSVAHAALLVGEHERAGHHAQLADEAELRIRPTSGLSRLQEELRVVRASIAAATGETEIALAEWRKTQRSLEESGQQLSLPVQRLAERYLIGKASAGLAEPPPTFDQLPSMQPPA